MLHAFEETQNKVKTHNVPHISASPLRLGKKINSVYIQEGYTNFLQVKNMATLFNSTNSVKSELSRQRYIASDEIATIVYLAEKLGKPLLAEGPAGVGKTELAKAIAGATGRELIRLQCYEGLDESKALYEWEYS